jgi:hypothetical protein
MATWTKGLRLDIKNDLIISWNNNKICFNILSSDNY